MTAVLASDGRELGVNPDGDLIEVTWLCGDTFRFTGGELEQVIENINTIAALPCGRVWLHERDHDGDDFHVLVENGRFHGQERVSSEIGPYLSWTAIKEALRPAPPVVEEDGMETEPAKRPGLLRWLGLRKA